ncbi:YncE family protein [Virgisporangium aurantiacum]|uniref:RanBP2-type domain-containing protein n=1 Tax=Virgisporangium aurantiacum TaxID=175570 RepID=A0A8J4E7D3_9ACTN|nr:hypothetical protein [Virgisporangium aurantiacum]GIJ64078.1 hypothetical protein Vau01_115940 [Virgisporangium aurantiacum]
MDGWECTECGTRNGTAATICVVCFAEPDRPAAAGTPLNAVPVARRPDAGHPPAVSPPAPAAVTRPRAWKRVLLWATAALVVAGGSAAYVGYTNRDDSSIPVGDYGDLLSALAIAPDGQHLFAVRRWHADVSLVRLRDGSVSRVTLPGDFQPGSLAVSPDGSRLYVSDGSTGDCSGTRMLTVDVTARTVSHTVTTSACRMYDIVAGPNGAFVYVTTDDGLLAVDTTTDEIVGTVRLPGAGAIAVDPDGRRVHVAVRGPEPALAVVSATTLGIAGLVPLVDTSGTPMSPEGLDLAPDGSTVYVACSFHDEAGKPIDRPGMVSVVDPASGTVAANLPLPGKQPRDVAVSPDGTRVYVANWGSGSVSMVMAAAGTVETVADVGGNPTDLAVSPDGRTVYVTTYAEKIAVVDAG